MLHASQDEATRQLAKAAETLYTTRDYEALEELARVLAGMSDARAKAAGVYYIALCERRRGQEVAAARLLQSVVSQEAAPRYKARAMQALRVIHRYAGDCRAAELFYNRAIEQATGPRTDLLTLVNATLARSEIISTDGDHRRALDELRAIQPAVEIVAQVHPVYAPLFANDIAFELLQAGRISEARRFAAYAVASPFAPRFLAWAETARAVEQAEQQKAAQNRIVRVEARPARSTARKRTPRNLFLGKLVLKALLAHLLSRQRVFTISRPDCLTISALVSLSARIRAPSFIF